MKPYLFKLLDNSVFVGLVEDPKADLLEIHEVQQIFYWDKTCKGLPGVCSKGVNAGCRVSGQLDEMLISRSNLRYSAKMTDRAFSSCKDEPWALSI